MKKTYFYLSIFLLFPSPGFAGMSKHKLDFVNAVDYALSSNQQIVASGARVKAMNQAVDVAKGAGLPKVVLDSTYERTNNPMAVFGAKIMQGKATFADFGANEYLGPQSLDVNPENLNRPDYYNNFNTGVNLIIPIFHGGADTAIINQMKKLHQAATHGDRYAKDELIYSILQTYEGVKAAERIEKIAYSAVKSAEKYSIMTKNLEKQSVTIASDFLMAEANLESAKANADITTNEKKDGLKILGVLIGKNIDEFTLGSSLKLKDFSDDIEQLIRKTRLENAKILSAKSQSEAAKSAIKASNARHLPMLDLRFRHDWSANTPTLGKQSNSAVLNMQWQIFNFGEHRAATQSAIAMHEEAIANVNQIVDSLHIAIVQARSAIKKSNIEFKTANQNEKKMEKIVSTLTERYGQGLIPLGQLLDAQMRLDGAKMQQAMAKYNKLLAQAKLINIVYGLSRYISESNIN